MLLLISYENDKKSEIFIKIVWCGEMGWQYRWNKIVHELMIFLKLIFIGVQLIYNIVLVSTVQQSESVIHTHISTLF